MQSRIESVVLNHLFLREGYLRKVLPFLKDEYFMDLADRTIFSHVVDYVEKYNVPPSAQAIGIALKQDTKLSETEYDSVIERLSTFDDTSEANGEWLLVETEKFCKNRAITNSITKAIQIIDGRDTKLSADAIPSILQEALAVTFDTSIGHDYLDNADERYEYYHRVENKIRFDIDLLNKVTKGGIPKKTLNIVMAETGKGKSIFLCHHAANCLSQGLNVLYITLEMAEERIAERIDANLLGVSMDDLPNISKKQFVSGIEKIKQKTNGKLIIQEYPTSSVHAGHFRALISELRIKKNFIPDVVVVDYLNLCLSSRLKSNTNANSYTIVKSVAEELRGLAVEQEVQMWSATQTNRNGFANSDIDITDTSESMGLTHTTDFFIALMQDEQMEMNNQCMIKQLKNRFGKMNVFRRFMAGLDKDYMRFYDLEASAQRNIMSEDVVSSQSTPVSGKNFSGIIL